LYGFGVFGYITATLASFFIGNDVQKSTLPAGSGDLEGVRVELMELKEMIKKLTESQHV
jgi:voltage-gated potassium channel